ncbi:MAG: redoxin domain-containing protein [Myxococcota bacterium]|nr:redoxin domain-containing protein [Myxococcota bacterium]
MHKNYWRYTLAILFMTGTTMTACAKDKQPPAEAGQTTAPKTAPVQVPAAAAQKATTSASAPNKKAKLGEMAPDFTLPQVGGSPVKLSRFLGKTVVLEWFNPDCPFVKLAHRDGPLPKNAAAHIQDGAVWLAINSGGPGKQGHGVARNTAAKAEYKLTWPILLDETGQVGKAYGATRTPHMYVINAEGILVYRGALDSTRGGGYDRGDYTNYLANALSSVKAKKPIAEAETKAWGCSVKYDER